MTKVYVPENLDSPIDPPPEVLIDESVLKPVENSENLEDIQFCHLMTVDTENQSAQAVEGDDSLVTVGDSDDSSRLNNDQLDRLSEKIEDENVTDCVEFIRTAISENDPPMAKDKVAPKLNFEFGSHFINKFLFGLILIWAVQVVTG